MEQGTGVKDRDVKAVRCVWCEARMFDSDGGEVEPEAAHVEVDIMCWRCKGVNVLYLSRNSQR